MPYNPKPFFRASRNTWFVEIDGHQLSLGHHPKHLPQPRKRDGAWDPPREILEAYHREMAQRGQPQTVPVNPGQGPAVVEVLDSLLNWLQKRVQERQKEPRTYDWYHSYLQSFANSISAELSCGQLAPIHVYQWVDAHPGWKTGKRGAMVAVQRAFTWAAKAGLLKAVGGVSPLTALEKPPQGKRGTIIPPAEFSDALAAVPFTNNSLLTSGFASILIASRRIIWSGQKNGHPRAKADELAGEGSQAYLHCLCERRSVRDLLLHVCLPQALRRRPL